MANLAFVFEAIAKHPELEDLCGDDIRDLLDVRRNKSTKRVGFMFFDLLCNILKVGDLHLEREGVQQDYSFILNHHTERIVRNKVSAYCWLTSIKKICGVLYLTILPGRWLGLGC
ncbi:MAG: hypothetical protein WCC17_13120 [Candidatus Nitrosopolaris sp.]